MTKLIPVKESPTLALMGMSSVTAEKEIVEDNGAPRIFNYTKQSTGDLKEAIQKALPDSEEGDAVLSLENKFYALPHRETHYVLLPDFQRQFWADRDNNKRLLKSSNSRKRFAEGKVEGTSGFQENFLSLMIILGVRDSEGNKLVPLVTVSTLDKSRCPFFAQAIKELKRTEEKEWASDNKLNGSHIKGKTPVGLRLTHRIKNKLDTAGHGKKYAKWNADSKTMTPELLADLAEHMESEQFQKMFTEAVETFKGVSESIDKKLV